MAPIFYSYYYKENNMAQLSYINTGVKQKPDLTFNIPTDESVGAMLFDISGFDKPLTIIHCCIIILKMVRFNV